VNETFVTGFCIYENRFGFLGYAEREKRKKFLKHFAKPSHRPAESIAI